MEKVSLTIDGQSVVAEEGATVLAAALAHGIYIPHLCYHPDFESHSACRLCLVDTGDGQLLPSCRLTVAPGMVVTTSSPEMERARRSILELMVADHHITCRGCPSSGQCELQRIMGRLRIDRKRLERLRLPAEDLPRDTSNPFFDYDPNKCVLCGICVKTCEEIQGADAIYYTARGHVTRIAPFGNKPLAQSRCESCGECVVRCPVGALVAKNVQRPKQEVRSVCPYCGVGCGIYLGTRGNAIVDVRGNPESPVNAGHLCVRGRYGWRFVHSPERLTTPLIKKNGEFVTASWDEALNLVADRLAGYQGKQFALLTATQLTNEGAYLAQKFARVVMGSNNIDNDSRLLQAPTLAALQKTVGIGATSPLSELADAAAILAIGTNTTETHPVVGARLRQATRKSASLIVVNPREIDLCRHAKQWLRLRPGTDAALIIGMCRVLLEEGLVDTSLIAGKVGDFAAFRETLRDFDLERVAQDTGIPAKLIAEAARLLATGGPVTIVYGAGVTQHSHGTDNVLALVNLAQLVNAGLGSLGLYPLWEDSNALGVCDMGGLPDFLPGYQAVCEPSAQAKFEKAWATTLSPEAGSSLPEVWPALREGKLKALYLIGADPISTAPGSEPVRQAIAAAEFMVAQDMFLTETAKLADVVLPAASFAEQEGTVTNMERRMQRIHKALETVGDARPDWLIITELARRMGGKGFDFTTPDEVLAEIVALVPSYREMTMEKESTLCAFPAVERRFAPLAYQLPEQATSADYPLLLMTEGCLYQHGNWSTKVEGLNALAGEPFLQINPEDAAGLGIANGQVVRVISRRGELAIKAIVSGTTPPGVVTLKGSGAESLRLLKTALDTPSQTPVTRLTAIRIVP